MVRWTIKSRSWGYSNKSLGFLGCLTVSVLVLSLFGCVTEHMSTASGNPVGSQTPSPGTRGNAGSNVSYADVGIRYDVAADLPKDQALVFLRSLYLPEVPAASSCRFEAGGVQRWWNGRLPGRNPYNATYLSLTSVDGIPMAIMLSVKGTREEWCMIVPYGITKVRGGDTKKLTNKIFTALVSMGAEVIPASEAAKGLHCRQVWCQSAERN
jgi:hypothetical protein